MKRILQIANLFPLFLALLIVGTVWKVGWSYVAARAGGGFLSKLAGAAAFQWN